MQPHATAYCNPLSDLEGGLGYGGCTPPPFQISKIKESNKKKQKIEDIRVACLSSFYVYMR